MASHWTTQCAGGSLQMLTPTTIWVAKKEGHMRLVASWEGTVKCQVTYATWTSSEVKRRSSRLLDVAGYYCRMLLLPER